MVGTRSIPSVSVRQRFVASRTRKMIVRRRPDSSRCERKFTIATPTSSRPNRRQPVRHSNEVCQSANGKVKLSVIHLLQYADLPQSEMRTLYELVGTLHV